MLCATNVDFTLLMPRPSPLQMNNEILKINLLATQLRYSFVLLHVYSWQYYISLFQIAVQSGKKHKSYASQRY